MSGSLLYGLCFLICLMQSLVAGVTCNRYNSDYSMNDSSEENDTVSMEIDLRSKNPDERTVHWFINDKQQKVMFTGVPETVEFAVCIYLIALRLSILYF